MITLFRKRPIVLNCYTDRPYVYERSPVLTAKQAAPKWFTDIPPFYTEPSRISPRPTLRTCSGVVEQFKHGVFIPMWSEMAIEVGAIGTTEWKYEYADRQSEAQVHYAAQRGTYLPEEKYQHLKLVSPWLFQCDEALPWQLMGASYHFDAPEDIFFTPGIVDYKYQYGTNINMIFKRKDQPYVLMLRHGQPLVQILPLSDRPLIVKQHLITREEFLRMDSQMTRLTFIGKYGKIKKLSKCPFGGS